VVVCQKMIVVYDFYTVVSHKIGVVCHCGVVGNKKMMAVYSFLVVAIQKIAVFYDFGMVVS